MYFCTNNHSKSFEAENENASAFKFLLNVALYASSICISVQMSILNLLKQRTQTPELLNCFIRCSERSFDMYFCTDDHSKSFETENENASVFKFFSNVALNARSLCISVQMIHSKSFETDNANASALKIFLNVALNAR